MIKNVSDLKAAKTTLKQLHWERRRVFNKHGYLPMKARKLDIIDKVIAKTEKKISKYLKPQEEK